MYNAASKLSPLLMATALLFASCGSKNDESAQAGKLVAEADSALKAGDYALALERLDTLKAKYPAQIEAQREGMHLRPLVIEGQTIKELESTDSLQSWYSHLQDSLMQYFTLVDNPQLVEGYYVIKEYAKSTLFNRTGVESRVSPDGQFYMISSLTSNPIKHTSISLTDGNGKVTTATVDYDGDRNYRSGGTEMITFTGAECDTLGYFLTDNQAKNIKLIFNGTKSHTTALSTNDRLAMQRAYGLSQAMTGQRRMAAKRDFLDKQLLLARGQAVRTSHADDGK